MPRFYRFLGAVLAALLIATSASLLAASASAQTYLGLTLEGGVPYDDFQDQLDDVALGVSGKLLVQAGALPVALGIDGGALTYGRQARPLPARIDRGSAFLGEVETTNNVAHLHGVLRLIPSAGAVRPYLDGLAGFNYFHTRTQFEQRVFLVDGDDFVDLAPGAFVGEQVTSSTTQDDFAFSYGAGAGLLIRIAAGDDDGTPFEAFLELGARYLIGEKASYLQEVEQAAGDVPAFRVVESETHLIRPQIGLTIQFGS